MSNGIRWQIFIEELAVMTRIGLHPHEHEKAQAVLLNIDLTYCCDIEEDNAEAVAIDYDQYCSLVCAYLGNKRHTRLLETLAFELAGWSFRKFPALEDIKIAIHKPKIRDNAARLGVAASWNRWRYETLLLTQGVDAAYSV
jgi:dihydroneopterin aldolase